MRSSRDLDEQDHRDPLCGGPNTHAGQQSHVDGPGHHHHGYEQGAQKRRPAEPLFEGRGDLHYTAEFLEFSIDPSCHSGVSSLAAFAAIAGVC